MQLKVWAVGALILGCCAVFIAEPLHAQCRVIWVFKAPCQNVSMGLTNQIKMWTSEDGCSMGGEKCLYELQSANVTHIYARHTSATENNVDDLMFRMKPFDEARACRVMGFSMSESIERKHDNGTNYCNLYNLVEGCGLTSLPDYKEISNDWMCTQRSSANCTIV